MVLPLTRPAPDRVAGRFRFRFVVRGEQSLLLLDWALRSLAHCHPGAQVVVVDANDHPSVEVRLDPLWPRPTVVHVRPGDDPVAAAVGRGSPRHLFYWRNSPEVRAALPAFGGFDVNADADLLFLRPLDLSVLVGPLGRGRIAAAVDESTLEHHAAINRVLPGPGWIRTGGPLWQTGLVFTNPDDDGSVFDLFWAAAVELAGQGRLGSLPGDDMALVAALLGCGGPLWERALALGHDWNYITDDVKDGGIRCRVAHFGGRRAKDLVLRRAPPVAAPAAPRSPVGWGTVHRDPATPGDTVARVWGAWHAKPANTILPVPFCLTWPVAAGTTAVRTTGELSRTDGATPVTIEVHVDGRTVSESSAADGPFDVTVATPEAETVTVVAAGAAGPIVRLAAPILCPTSRRGCREPCPDPSPPTHRYRALPVRHDGFRRPAGFPDPGGRGGPEGRGAGALISVHGGPRG